MARLADADLSMTLSRHEQDERLAVLGDRLATVRLAIGGKMGDPRLGPPVTLVMEGWDASGKGGAIRRLVQPLDARHVRVATYAAPSPDELRHHYLSRFTAALPGTGGMTIFDRSWYGRILVERVEGFATEAQWRRAYDEIVNFERTLADSGMIIVKLWLEISPDEQLRRFKRREQEPLKRWKLTEEDWRNRDKRSEYEVAVEEMLERTDRSNARWHVVPAESKRYARVRVMEILIEEIERGCRSQNFELP